MTLRNFLQSLARRWYLVVGGLIITGILGYGVYVTVPPSYERTASILLLPSAKTIPEGGNAYLYLGGLGQASDVLVSAVNANSVRDAIMAGHSGAEMTVKRDAASTGPLLAVTVSGSSNAEVTELLHRVLDGVPATLLSLQTQANVPAEARIRSLTLSQDPQSALVRKNQLQAVGVLAAGGLTLTLLLAGFIDGLALSRRKRRPEVTLAKSEAEPTASSPEDSGEERVLEPAIPGRPHGA